MAPTSKADEKATADAAAWMFNVVTSVGIIIVNKALMATYGFSFFFGADYMCSKEYEAWQQEEISGNHPDEDTSGPTLA